MIGSELRLLNLSPDSCDGCGLCCEGIGSPVLLYASRPGFGESHPFRPADLPRELIEEIDFHFSGLTRGQEPLARCLWFDPVSRRCRHYEHRPQLCRDYELGGEACRSRQREAVQNGEAVSAPTVSDATVPAATVSDESGPHGG